MHKVEQVLLQEQLALSAQMRVQYGIEKYKVEIRAQDAPVASCPPQSDCRRTGAHLIRRCDIAFEKAE